MSVVVRLGGLGQVHALEALQLRASLANPGDRELVLAHPESVVLPLAQIRNSQVFVAEEGQALRGFCSVLDREDGDVELDGLFVEPSHWRAGVGRLLVERAKQYARERSASWLHVIGNHHAEGFYEARGFAIYGSHETEFGVGLLMRAEIEAAKA